ncbi:MAG: hypothetical protein JXB23_11320 [Candidatus Aminicenantes bacterium]|nr:hypothetical protein [Candidatus Aminicenantes bacterium]
MTAEDKPKLTQEEFIHRAVKKLRGNYKGIHSVYSGFNTAFKEYFGTNPVETTQKLVKEGKIVTRPVKGGVIIYLPEDAPSKGSEVLNKILEDDE